MDPTASLEDVATHLERADAEPLAELRFAALEVSFQQEATALALIDQVRRTGAIVLYREERTAAQIVWHSVLLKGQTVAIAWLVREFSKLP